MEGWSKMGKGETKVACLSFLCLCLRAFDRTRIWVIRLKGVRAEREEDNGDRTKKKKRKI